VIRTRLGGLYWSKTIPMSNARAFLDKSASASGACAEELHCERFCHGFERIEMSPEDLAGCCLPLAALRRPPGPGRLGHLNQTSGGHVVDVAVDRDPAGHERMGTDPGDVLDNALRVVRDGQPVDVVGFR